MTDRPALTAAELHALLGRFLATGPRQADAKAVIAYDPGHATRGSRPTVTITGLGGGIDWDQGKLFLHTATPVGIVPATVRQKLRRYENFLGHLQMHLRHAQAKGQAPSADVIQSFLRHLQDGTFEDTLPHWDTAAVRTEAQLAQDLGITVATLRRRERARQVLALPDPLTAEKFYPAYQAWAAVGGKVFISIIAAFRNRPDQVAQPWGDVAPALHAWLTQPQDRLEGRLPLEVLVGETFGSAEPTPTAQQQLSEPHAQRVVRVIAVAIG